MRFLAAICTALIFSALATAQVHSVRGYAGYYGNGPYVPLVTTPQISLQTVSPSPVGASNATYGLVAGARNSTLSILNEGVSSVYTVPVWYSGGGAPMIESPEVSLYPHYIHEGHVVAPEGMRMGEMRMERHEGRTAAQAWTYYASPESTSSAAEAAAAAKGAKPAVRTITNQDIDKLNQSTGVVKYDSKTEKIQ